MARTASKLERSKRSFLLRLSLLQRASELRARRASLT